MKIEPVDSTKVITFYTIKSSKKPDEEDDQENSTNKMLNRIDKVEEKSSQTYKLAITNMIGISLIDASPREVIQITIKNLVASFATFLDSSDIVTKDKSDDASTFDDGRYVRQMVVIDFLII